MELTKTKFFTFVCCPGLFILSYVLLYNSFRSTAFVLMIALAVSYFHFLRTSRTTVMRLLFVSFLIAVFLPIDVTLKNLPGPPRFVPLVMGAPREQDEARAERGEVILGGCIRRGNEPRWVWVW